LKKWYLQLLSKRLKKEEINCLNSFDAVYTVTQIDEEIFKNHGLIRPSTFIPTGLDATKSLEKSDVVEEFPSLFFIGALDWIPNQEGLYWFVDCVLPKVYEKFPEVKFYIAGRRPNDKIRRLNSKKVIVLGEVEDAQEYMESKGIMIVPLFSGSGMRVKIIEGMMLSKAIVSTSVGVEGILVENNKNILVVDDYQQFAEAIIALLSDFEKYKSIKNNAYESAILNYSAEILDKKLDNFLRGLV
jgi:glycosyltransferase involved in cell wall biosynthesis